MNLDLASIIDEFTTDTVTLRHYDAATMGVNGKLSARNYTDTANVKVVIQPVAGRDWLREPEGFRATEQVSIWSSTQLANGDLIYLPSDETRYEIEGLVEWNKLGNFWKALARKLPQDEHAGESF